MLVYSTPMKHERFDKNRWIDHGLEHLSSAGSGSINIDSLCESASKTKGSFYFHFETLDAYLILLAERWHRLYTLNIINTGPQKSNRLDCLNRLVARMDLGLETAIRALALQNDHVARIVQEADEARTNWLTKLYEKTGKYKADEANALAKIEIAAFAGFKLIAPQMEASQARSLYDDFLKLTSRA